MVTSYSTYYITEKCNEITVTHYIQQISVDEWEREVNRRSEAEMSSQASSLCFCLFMFLK